MAKRCASPTRSWWSGLDHDGLGRNLPGIPRIVENTIDGYQTEPRVFGPPGAGKGTQSEYRSRGMAWCTSAPVTCCARRSRRKRCSGLEAKEIMDRGDLRPTTHDIVISATASKRTTRPRASFSMVSARKAQAEALDGMLGSKSEPITAMLALEVPRRNW